ncbi:MAG: DUF922 domain-containing protein [Candidatus Cyclobacteriaceae bacterium M2_1C_046]
MKKLILFFFTLIISCGIYAQDKLYNPAEYIPWASNFKLNWELYEAKPDAGYFGDAGTAVKIQAKPSIVNGSVDYQVHALFNKKKSWYKERSDELLAHEQLHFDIAELTARKIRKRIDQLKKANVKDIKIYNEEIEKLLNASNALDDEYDKKTLHGILKKEQSHWEKQIYTELKKLSKYELETHIFN